MEYPPLPTKTVADVVKDFCFPNKDGVSTQPVSFDIKELLYGQDIVFKWGKDNVDGPTIDNPKTETTT